MFESRGLRLSLAGGVLILISSLTLLVLPDLVSSAGLLIGACAVGAGFIWTMAEFYIPQQPPPDA